MPGDTARENGKKGGRPKARHTLEASALRAYIIEEVVKQKSALVKKLIEKAKGGDIAAIKELLDRTLGKSKEQVDITSGGKPIPILGNVSRNNGDKEDRKADSKDSGDSGGNVSEQNS